MVQATPVPELTFLFKKRFNMKKKLILAVLTFLFCGNAFCQTEQEALKQRFEVYFKSLKEMDNEQTVDCYYPKFFEYVPRSLVLEALNNLEASLKSTVSMDFDSILFVAEILKHESSLYTLIKYSYVMHLNLAKTNTGNTEEQMAIESQLKSAYGKENVSYDHNTGIYSIMTIDEVYAINDPVYSVWYFLKKEPATLSIVEEIMPKKVLKRL